MSNIEKIRKEIEKQRGFIEGLFIEGDNNFYDGQDDAYNHLLAFIDSLPEEKPSEGLEEAAKEYVDKVWLFGESWVDVTKDTFIAGAEWQARQLLKSSPLPEDTVLFQKGVEEGKRLMMEEAVEGEIGYWNQRGLSIRLDQSLEKLGYGEDTEVKIIIVKQDD